MTFGIVSLESGKLLASFDSEDAALEAVQLLFREEPEAHGSISLVEFADNGHPEHARQGDELAAALHGATA